MIKLTDIYNKFEGNLYIEKGGRWMPITEGYCKEFDLDLKFGKMGEKFTEEVFEGKSLVETKTERDIWKSTGNLAFEIRYKGQPSGVSTTGSHIWIHLLAYNNEILGGFIFKVPKLKEMLKEAVRGKRAKMVMGGDDNMSQIILMPMNDLKEFYSSVI